MDSEDEIMYDDVDSGTESTGDDVEIEVRSQEVDEYPFRVLSTEEIVQDMTDTIKEINTVVNIPAPTTRFLLHHFKWDKDKLMERFFDGDQEKLFTEAHVVNPFLKGPLIKRNNPHNVRSKHGTNVTEECGVCFSTLPPSQLTGLECGHRFCNSCWGEYLTTKIMEEGVGQTIACAAHACDILVDDITVMKLVKDFKVKSKYQHLITNSFVQCNRLLRWCPIPDCNSAIKVQCVDMKPVTCKCNHTFCFQCGENWHDPVDCRLLRKWLKKCNDDSETTNWITANTKECTKCNVPIEKNGGCNHMTCKNVNCRFEFCWLCLAAWRHDSYSNHKCNRYDAQEVMNAKEALDRYLFFCNRYMNHMKSLKFEGELYAKIKVKMDEMQQHNMSWIEVQYLEKAVDILCSCRQTLMYTYAFAFYLRKNNQSVMFEANQNDLENATESLSEYLEKDITNENLVDIKLKVQDKYRYCEGRRELLSEHVHEGYENDLWEYIE